MIKPSDFNPLLMLDQGINAVIAESNEHIEGMTKDSMKLRLRTSQTMALYHTVLNMFLNEATTVVMKKGKPTYPEKRYLGNIIINYLAKNHTWKVTITNGGRLRKNAKIPLKIKETLYLRRLDGHYFVDSDYSDTTDTRRMKTK